LTIAIVYAIFDNKQIFFVFIKKLIVDFSFPSYFGLFVVFLCSSRLIRFPFLHTKTRFERV
jgi:hypothetical protein